LNDIQEEVCVLELLQLLAHSFDPVARMEDVKLFLAFVGRLSRKNSKVTDMLLEAPSDIWLALKLSGSVDAHVFDDL